MESLDASQSINATQTLSKKPTVIRKKTVRRSLPLEERLSRIYENVSGENCNLEGLGAYPTQYGEILPESIKILFEVFSKYAPLTKITMANKNFYDLGCGIGKVAIGFSYLNQYLKSTGIEIVPERVKKANEALSRIRDDSIKKRVELLCLSLLDDTLHYYDACWIYVSNIYFPHEMNIKIFDKLSKELKIGSVVICTQSFDHPLFKELNIFNIPMSWSNLSKVFVYTKK